MLPGWTVLAGVALFGSSLYIGAVAARVWRFVPNWLGVSFGALAGGICIWNVGYGFEILSPDLGGKIFWAKFQYVGILSTPVAWLFVALSYTRRERWLGSRVVMGLSAVPVLMLLLVWTNELHGLIWSRVALLATTSYPMLDVDYGPVFWISTAYAYVLMAIAAAVVAEEIATTARLFRAQRFVLLIAAICPWFGNMLHLAGLAWLRGVDPTPFGFCVSAVAVGYGLQRRRLVELAPMARRAMFEFIDAGAIILDLEGRVLDLNPAAEKILGVHESVFGRPIETWFCNSRPLLEEPHGVLRASQRNFTNAAGRTGHYELALYPIRGLDGDVFARLLVIDEATRRVEALDALDESQRRFEALIESIPGIVWEARLEPLEFTFVSSKTEALLGYPATRWTDDANFWIERMHPEDRDWVLDFVEEMERAGRAHEFEYRMIHADGTPVWFRDVVGAPGPDTMLLSGIMVDITERKRLEQHVQQVDRLETIDRFAAGMAHDFNNLVTAITVYGELAKDSLDPGHPACAEVDGIIAACDRAAELTGTLLTASRAAGGEPRPMELNDILVKLEPMLQRLVGDDIALDMNLTRDLRRVTADPADVEQLIMNLATNARDAMPFGGQLTIATTTATLPGAADERGPPEDAASYTVLVVGDTGVGMSQDDQARIFDPFFTTKTGVAGTGLGLTSVGRVVRQIGGTIEVASAVGDGSVFKIYFPGRSRIAESPDL